MLDFSNPLHPLAAAACLAVAYLTASLLTRIRKPPSERGKFASIDGLRGFLAFSVFIHHASIWFFYLETGRWALPPSRLYSHLGQSSVELFFMITSFLFIRKITTQPGVQTSWQTLFVHRFFRLTPLYAFAMVCFLGIVVYLSHGHRTESWLRIASESLRWMIFSMGGMESINGTNAGLVLAWVPWSLQYEWVFYLSLPLIAVLIRRRVPLSLVVGCVLVIACASINLPEAGRYFYGFAGGAIAAYFVQFKFLGRFAQRPIGSLIVILIGLGMVRSFDSAYTPAAMISLTVVFTLIACGADLFGLLVRPASLLLGESAYSIYLMHPFFLFIGIGLGAAQLPSLWIHTSAYWLLIVALTPALVLSCAATYRYVELRGIAAGPRFDQWLRSRRARVEATASVAGPA